MSRETTKPTGEGVLGLEVWRSLAEAVPDMLLLVDRTGKVLYVNRTPNGTNAADTLGQSVLDLAMANPRAEMLDSLEDIFEGGAARSRESRVTLPDVGERWFATRTGPLVVDNTVVAAVIVARDVTEAKHSQVRLAESEARYRTLVEFASEAIVVFDVDLGTFVDANTKACALFGMTRDQLCEMDPLSLSPRNQLNGRSPENAMGKYLDDALEGGAPAFEWLHHTAEGERLCCEVRLGRMPSAGRRLVHGSITDITRQRRFEQQLLQWQRMDAIGQLAGGIAHDFMNILAVILASAQVITRVVNDSELRADAMAIEAAAQRGAALASRLLTFARRESATGDTIADVNQVVLDVSIMLSRVLNNEIRLIHDLDSGAVTAHLSRCKLEQVLMNLLINARDAIHGPGSITISTSRGHQRGEFSRLSVVDTGAGICSAVQHRMFEPFFTTRPERHSTGLGLSTVLGIVNEAGGRVEVKSAPGEGSRFDVFLPV